MLQQELTTIQFTAFQNIPFQDNSPNVQNISIIESQAENGNQLHGQPHKAITDDAKTNIDHHDRKVDAVPGHIKGTDHVFVNGILPQVTTMHGILSFLPLRMLV